MQRLCAAQAGLPGPVLTHPPGLFLMKGGWVETIVVDWCFLGLSLFGGPQDLVQTRIKPHRNTEIFQVIV